METLNVPVDSASASYVGPISEQLILRRMGTDGKLAKHKQEAIIVTKPVATIGAAAVQVVMKIMTESTPYANDAKKAISHMINPARNDKWN